MSEPLKIIALTVVAGIAYGIVHDQITVRICLEYFTIGHPRIIASEDPTLLALVWGVVATWWVGLALGVLLAIAARYGPRPKRSARSLVGVVGNVVLVMAVCAGSAGLAVWELAAWKWITLVEPLASDVPADRHHAFLAVGAAHTMSYAAALLGGLTYACGVWRSRKLAPQSAG